MLLGLCECVFACQFFERVVRERKGAAGIFEEVVRAFYFGPK